MLVPRSRIISPLLAASFRLVAPSAAICSRWFLARGFLYPADGGYTFLRNIGSHKIYTAPHPRKRHYSTHILSEAIPDAMNNKRVIPGDNVK
jgi:hypothetical protein